MLFLKIFIRLWIESLLKYSKLYFFLDGHDYKNHVDSVAIEQSIPYITKKPVLMCSDQFEKLALQIMIREDLLFPIIVAEARALYEKLIEVIETL